MVECSRAVWGTGDTRPPAASPRTPSRCSRPTRPDRAGPRIRTTGLPVDARPRHPRGAPLGPQGHRARRAPRAPRVRSSTPSTRWARRSSWAGSSRVRASPTCVAATTSPSPRVTTSGRCSGSATPGRRSARCVSTPWPSRPCARRSPSPGPATSTTAPATRRRGSSRVLFETGRWDEAVQVADEALVLRGTTPIIAITALTVQARVLGAAWRAGPRRAARRGQPPRRRDRRPPAAVAGGGRAGRGAVAGRSARRRPRGRPRRPRHAPSASASPGP